MKKILLLFALIFSAVQTYAAEWELLHEQSAAYGFFITQEGVMLLSDYDDMSTSGGIFYSEDNGLSWEKSNAKDFYYSKFLEVGDYVFAVGYKCRIARSEDGGRTWDILNYSRACQGLPNATTSNLNSSAAYGIVYHNNRLYVSDFSFGVVASDDWGETWEQVDPESMTQNVDDGGKGGGKLIENLYMLSEYDGTLLAYGLYNVYKYDDTTGKWSIIRGSNCMAVNTIFHGALFTGCSMPNDNFDTPFLYRTTDLKKWSAVAHPTGVMDTNVRALSSDQCRIYAALQWGGVYMTSDEGATWHKLCDGLPHVLEYGTNKETDMLLSTLQVWPAKDYLYAVIYNEPWNDNQHTSGLYRISMADLEAIDPTSVSTVQLPAVQGLTYDLLGRRSANANQGVQIVDGKKMIR